MLEHPSIFEYFRNTKKIFNFRGVQKLYVFDKVKISKCGLSAGKTSKEEPSETER